MKKYINQLLDWGSIVKTHDRRRKSVALIYNTISPMQAYDKAKTINTCLSSNSLHKASVSYIYYNLHSNDTFMQRWIPYIT